MKQAKAKPKPSKLNLRLDDSLREQVAAAAEQYERSLNSEIVYRLRSSFEQESSGETRAS
jgi:predicted HicB family RNase H-like nuclease